MREMCWKCQGGPRGFMPCTECGAVGELGRSLLEDKPDVVIFGKGAVPGFLHQLLGGGGKPRAEKPAPDAEPLDPQRKRKLKDAILRDQRAAGSQREFFDQSLGEPWRETTKDNPLLREPWRETGHVDPRCCCHRCISRTARALANQAASALTMARDPEESARLAETIVDAMALEARHREAAEEGRG